MTPLDLADLVVIAGKTLGLDSSGTLNLMDLRAAEIALATARPAADGNDPAAGAAGLLHALVRQHPFGRGSEQVAIVAATAFLAINGWQADLDPPEAALVVIADVAAGRLAAADLAAWLTPRLSLPHQPPPKEAPMHGWRPGRGRLRKTGGMLDRFTSRAREVIIAAQDEARALRHNYVGTEHLLLGLLSEGEGVAGRALDALGIRLDDARRQVLQIIGEGKQAPAGHLPLTPRARKVLSLALREAMQLDHLYVGTEHLLLGLLTEGSGVAYQVLSRLGADEARVRQQILRLLADHPRSRGPIAEPPEIYDLDLRIAQARREKDAAIDAQDFGRAAAVRDTEKDLLAEREERITRWSAGADVVALGRELDRLRYEVRRLQDLLLRHGVEPGDADQLTA